MAYLRKFGYWLSSSFKRRSVFSVCAGTMKLKGISRCVRKYSVGSTSSRSFTMMRNRVRSYTAAAVDSLLAMSLVITDSRV